MARTYYNYEVDPFNSDAPTEYRRIQTAYYGGSEDNFTGPASPNFPVNTPTRYFLKVPYIIDVSDLLGSRPVLMRDVTGAVNLTIVTGSPGANEFRVVTDTDSQARGTIELNVAQASDELGLDCYVIGGVLNSADFNSIDITGTVTAEGGDPTTDDMLARKLYVDNGYYMRPSMGGQIDSTGLAGLGAVALTTFSQTRIVLYDTSRDWIQAYDYTVGSWSTVGSPYTLAGSGLGDLAAITSSRVAHADGNLETLQTYNFNGSTWSTVGSGLSLTGIGNCAITALNTNNIAFIDINLNSLRKYSFNGSAWSLVGSGLTVSVGDPGLTTLDDNLVVLADGTNIRIYTFSGSAWSLTASTTLTGAGGATRVTALTPSHFVYIDEVLENFRIYHYDGVSTITQVGALYGISGLTDHAMTTLTSNRIVFIDDGAQDLIDIGILWGPKNINDDLGII